MKADEALAVLSTLAQDARLSGFRVLQRRLPDGMTAGPLAAAAKCAPSTLTFHMQHLAGAGLVRTHRQARSVIYVAVPGTVRGLTVFPTRECCQDRPERCGLPAAEGEAPGKSRCGTPLADHASTQAAGATRS